MEKTVYVIGHTNPDTDAVVSAYGYAKLKNLLGFENFKAARAGHLNPQTSYIFEKFRVNFFQKGYTFFGYSEYQQEINYEY